MKRIEVFTLDIEESVEPVIPEGEGCEETDGSNPWERKWQQIWKKIRVSLAPSIRETQEWASGIVRLKKVRIKIMLKGLNNIGMMRAPTVSPK